MTGHGLYGDHPVEQWQSFHFQYHVNHNGRLAGRLT
jgi:hypothetical protein